MIDDLKVWIGPRQGDIYGNADCDCDCSIIPLTIENSCRLIKPVDFADLRGKELAIAENLVYGDLDTTTSYVLTQTGPLASSF